MNNKTMRRCRYITGKFGSITALLSIAVGIAIISGNIYVFENSPLNGVWIIIALSQLGFALFLLHFGIKCCAMENRKFHLTTTGIVVKNRKETCYAWAQIDEIAVIAYAAASSMQRYQTVICIFLKPKEPDSLKKMLTSYFYGVKNMDKLIILDYCPDLLAEFLNAYPHNIPDYRKEQFENHRFLKQR